jgi:hypothetical protein
MCVSDEILRQPESTAATQIHLAYKLPASTCGQPPRHMAGLDIFICLSHRLCDKRRSRARIFAIMPARTWLAFAVDDQFRAFTESRLVTAVRAVERRFAPVPFRTTNLTTIFFAPVAVV